MANLIISKFNTVSVYISILKMENYMCKNDNSHFLLSMLIYFCLLESQFGFISIFCCLF